MFYAATLHMLSISFCAHIHAEVKCSLTSCRLRTSYRPKPINAAGSLGSYFPLRAPISDVAYEMTRLLNITSSPALALNLCGTILPVMELSHSPAVHLLSTGSTANSL